MLTNSMRYFILLCMFLVFHCLVYPSPWPSVFCPPVTAIGSPRNCHRMNVSAYSLISWECLDLPSNEKDHAEAAGAHKEQQVLGSRSV
eukprot:jgi/Botrbrau1/5519/Bobra.0023s0007.1